MRLILKERLRIWHIWPWTRQTETEEDQYCDNYNKYWTVHYILTLTKKNQVWSKSYSAFRMKLHIWKLEMFLTWSKVTWNPRVFMILLFDILLWYVLMFSFGTQNWPSSDFSQVSGFHFAQLTIRKESIQLKSGLTFIRGKRVSLPLLGKQSRWKTCWNL